MSKIIKERKGDTSVIDQMRKIENDPEINVIKNISSSLSRELTNIRIKMKLTQKDLANKINKPLSFYSDLENGKAIYSVETKQTINKIEKFLNIKLENK
jgi:ribosome-binding protein aMBF1 (putative translation factor)